MTSELVYNNLSPTLKKKLNFGVPLKRDEVVSFKLCYIPEIKQNGKLAPSHTNIRVPNTDTIYDPETGEYIQIAYVQKVTGNKEEPYVLGEVMFSRGDEGILTFSGKEPSKFPMLYYMRACNYNQKNPLAIKPSNGYIFYELEPQETAKSKVKDRKEKAECAQYILGMKDADLAATLSALRQPILGSIEENQEALLSYIEKKENRDKFLAQSTDVRTPIAALITRAEEEEKIRYESEPKNWILVETKKTIIQVPPQMDTYEALINYFHNDKQGKAIKDYLEKELEAKVATEALVDAKEDLKKAEVKEVVKNPHRFQKKESV